MQSASTMNTEDTFSISASDADIHFDDLIASPNFEIHDDVQCKTEQDSANEVWKKYRHSPASAANTLIANKKTIISFVGPSNLYLVMKGMKLNDSDVTTIKFVGTFPRSAIPRYLSTRPNIRKVITEYGPSSCTWTEFDGVRKNLTSFVVRSGDEYLDVCHFIDF